jgi:UDP:flavonoid glycosyltransferase YjiC (YdhE family)
MHRRGSTTCGPRSPVPQGADQFDNAAACLAAGVGLRLLPDELTPLAVHSAVASLMEESSYRERARDVAAEISALPTPSELVSVLVDELADRVAYD